MPVNNLTYNGKIMKKELIQKPEIKLMGISTRTNNKNELTKDAKIPQMWMRYLSENISSMIPNRKNPGVTFSVYTDYENNENGEYTYFLGEEVDSLDNEPKSLKQLIIPKSTYQKFTTSTGKIPDVVIQAWQQIWKMSPKELGGKRLYQSDFEIYDERSHNPENAVADILIGIEN